MEAIAPTRIPALEEAVGDVQHDLAALRSDVRALTMALKTAVALLTANGALNLADLLR